MKYVFGVDIGGTTVKMGLLSDEGKCLEKWEINTDKSNGGEKILPDVAASIEAKLKEKNISKDDVIGVGAGVPGPVDSKGVVHKAVNLGWGTFDAAETLSKLTGLKAMVGNDANVAALGEMWLGGGIGYSDIVMVTLGTGVGGGIIIDGKIVNGSSGAGGEIGHMHMKDDEEKACGCGGHGCLEQYASATGISRTASEKFASWGRETVLTKDDLSAKAVFDGVKAGDELCIEIATEFGNVLGKGLAMIAAVVNPEAFVIGGGVSKAGEILLNYITPSFDKYAFSGSKNAKMVLATLGNDAGMYGAAKLVL
ncbi:MAG: ROK family glucokinase [Lachnospiraceae bacterium]|nr:ROK family glucokinase [Lachnospiraceae bacterium]